MTDTKNLYIDLSFPNLRIGWARGLPGRRVLQDVARAGRFRVLPRPVQRAWVYQCFGAHPSCFRCYGLGCYLVSAFCLKAQYFCPVYVYID